MSKKIFLTSFTKKVLVLVFLSITPFLWLYTQVGRMGDFWFVTANVTGFIAATLMLWQFLLGNRTLFKKFSPDYISIIRLHIGLGSYGTVLAFGHPFLETATYGTAILTDFSLATSFDRGVALGRVGLFLFALIWISSAILRDKLKYRPWLYIHYLSYPMLGLVFLHARQIGTFFSTIPAIGLYWNFLTAVFVALLGYRLARYLNIGKPRYVLSKKKKLKDGITQYTFKPKNKKIVPESGQFLYLRPNFFGESHPFTIMEFDEESGTLTFGIKAVGKFTNHLESVKKGDTIYVDGPYGVFTQEGQNDNPKVIIAGGIGVTPFVELVDRFGNEKTYMFYANKKLEDAVNRDMFKEELGQNYKDVVSREKVKNEPVIEGRLTIEAFKENLPEDILEEANFFMCGSPGFMAGVSKILGDLGVAKERIYSEEFSL